MEFMLDTLNLDEIKKWARVLPLAGVTSNPTIAKKEGDIDFFDRIHKVREIIGGSPSIHNLLRQLEHEWKENLR